MDYKQHKGKKVLNDKHLIITCPHCSSIDLDLIEHFCYNCTEYFD